MNYTPKNPISVPRIGLMAAATYPQSMILRCNPFGAAWILGIHGCPRNLVNG